jgi:hypothetical protein
MNGLRQTILALAGAVLLVVGVAAEQTKPAVTPAPAPQRPSDEGETARPKLIAPARGEVELGHTKPVSKRDGNMVVTTIRVKNLANGAIAGLKVDEFWYDKSGNPVAGAPSFRYRKPLMPGEVIDVVLKTPVNPAMNQPQWKFEHANGKIKPVLMPKL